MPIEGLDILKPGDDEPKKKHITKNGMRVDDPGVHDCIHDKERHICGCEIGYDHEALNP